MKTVISTLVAAVTLAVMAPAQADGSFGYRQVPAPVVYGGHPGSVRVHPLEGLQEINMRQERMRARIERGFHAGAITRWEFRRLMAEQQDIQAMERAFVSDGFLTPRERFELTRRLDIASANIRFEGSDRERRF